jgi:hypothetical protein
MSASNHASSAAQSCCCETAPSSGLVSPSSGLLSPRIAADSFRWNPYSTVCATVRCGVATPLPWDASDAGSTASSGGGATPEDAAAARRVAVLRSGRTDADVARLVAALPRGDLLALHAYLARHRGVVEDLCLNSRGVIVCDVLAAAAVRGAGAHGLFAAVEALMVTLASSQSGCVALSRIYDVASPDQRVAVEDFVAANVAAFAAHPFANYLVTLVVEGCGAACVGRQLADPRVFAQLATTKTGSAVLEKFLKLSHDAAVLPVITGALAANEQLARASCDRFGNYVVQAIVRRLFAMRGAEAVGAQQCAAHAVMQATAFSPHRINIRNGLAKAATHDPGQRVVRLQGLCQPSLQHQPVQQQQQQQQQQWRPDCNAACRPPPPSYFSAW